MRHAFVLRATAPTLLAAALLTAGLVVGLAFAEPAGAAPAGTAPAGAAPAASAAGWAGDCPTTLKMHGLLSRARSQCGFRFYSERMLNDVKACRAKTAKADVTKTLTAGVTLFDKVDKAKGHKTACQQMAKNFPMVVQP